MEKRERSRRRRKNGERKNEPEKRWIQALSQKVEASTFLLLFAVPRRSGDFVREVTPNQVRQTQKRLSRDIISALCTREKRSKKIERIGEQRKRKRNRRKRERRTPSSEF